MSSCLMWTQKEESDWVNVANDLLSKCCINQRLRKLTDCDANIFIALYEAIVGEKVPDYIEVPSCQEDDVHNVQSVIDSLSLDYLQISLSHITGENVVSRHKESIKNLLDIFEGLYEYLTEELQNEELNVGPHEDTPPITEKPISCNEMEPESKVDGASLTSSVESAVQSSKHSLHSLKAEETGSNRVAVPLRTSDAISKSGPLGTQEISLIEPLSSTIALQRPQQSHSHYRPTADSDSNHSFSVGSHSHAHADDEEAEVATEVTQGLAAGLQESHTHTDNYGQRAEPVVTKEPPSPVLSKKSLSSQKVATELEGEVRQPDNGVPSKVLLQTEPDVLFFTQPNVLFTLPDVARTSSSLPDTEEDEEELSYTQRQKDRLRIHRQHANSSSRTMENLQVPLSSHKQNNKRAEEELHHISENLSQRIAALHQMLKQLGGESEECSTLEPEERQTPHSMDGHETHRQNTGSADPESTHGTRSPSPSPSPGHCSLAEQHQDTRSEALTEEQTKLRAAVSARHPHHRPSHRKHSKHLGNKAYEEELKRYEDRKQEDLHRVRLKAQEAEQEYRETILKDVPHAPRSSSARTKPQQKSKRSRQTTADLKRQEHASKVPPMKQNDVLSMLLEELPHLQISPQSLDRMWEQQRQQVDRLHRISSSHNQRHRNLSNQLEDAQRKHDMLVEIVRKDKEHKKRLREVKEQARQQKSIQSTLRERRQQVTRAKKYYNEYHVQHRARLMRARTKEERMFRQLFEESLELQKLQLREQIAYAREQSLEHEKRCQDQIKSMENYFKDQFSLLADKFQQEQQEIQVRKKAREKALLKLKQELRSRMTHEICDLQKLIVKKDEEDHFKELEVQRLQNRLHMASFQYKTGCL